MADQPGAAGPRMDWTINIPILMGIISAVVVIALGFLSVRDGLNEAIAKIDRKADEIKSENKNENSLQNHRLNALDQIVTTIRTEDAAFRSNVQQLLTTLSGDLATVKGVISAERPRR